VFSTAFELRGANLPDFFMCGKNFVEKYVLGEKLFFLLKMFYN
jgi:hypothetical protein